MRFTRTKKITFFNNKGGVGKTTLAYNTAVKFAEMGYKTVLVDLDPQCNLSQLSLGNLFEESIFSTDLDTVYTVISGILTGGRDVELNTRWHPINKNLFVLPGSLKLSSYENLLTTAYNQAAAGEEIGYFITSALHRFLTERGLRDEIDLFVIDTSPSLGLLNRVIFLDTDYFVTPLMPDAFSLQGVENLGLTFEGWRENWKNTGRALARDVASNKVLSGEAVFVGYILNSYNQYAKKPIKGHRIWMERIPSTVKQFLSEKHTKNGLVEKSWSEPLMVIKDYGELPADAQMHTKAIFNLDPQGKECSNIRGTLENLEKSKEEFTKLSENIIGLLAKY
jgi:cellulose biosynthesis protein BcsQ